MASTDIKLEELNLMRTNDEWTQQVEKSMSKTIKNRFSRSSARSVLKLRQYISAYAQKYLLSAYNTFAIIIIISLQNKFYVKVLLQKQDNI